MENTALVPYTPPLDAAALESLGAAWLRVVEAARRLKEAVLEAFAPVMRSLGDVVGSLYESMLRCVATGREWHLMKHARRSRTRRKYRSRLSRRLLTLLASADKEEDADEFS